MPHYRTHSVTVTVDTAAYANGDLLFNPTAIAVGKHPNDAVNLLSLTIVDPDGQKTAMDIFFTSSSTSWGTLNAAASISEANAQNIQSVAEIAVADWVDTAGVDVVHTEHSDVLQAEDDTNQVYVAGVVRGAATFAGGELHLKIGVAEGDQ